MVKRTGAGRAVKCLILIILFLAPAVTAAEEKPPRDVYGEARKYMALQKWAEALDRLKFLEKRYPILADYILFDAALCYGKSHKPEEALGPLREIIKNHRSSPLYREAYRGLLKVVKTGDAAAALPDFDGYLKEFPEDGKILWEKSEILTALDRHEEALALWKKLFLSGQPEAMKAYEKLRGKDRPPAYAVVKDAATNLVKNRMHLQVLSLLEGRPPDEEGKYLLGEAYFGLRRYRDAVSVLAGISSGEGRYLLARSYARAGQNEDFYRMVDEFAKEGRKDAFDLHVAASQRKGREGRHEEAWVILNSLPALYPERKKEIHWLQTWFAIRQNRLSQAESLLTELAAGSEQREKYLFWLGKVKIYQGKDGAEDFSRIRDPKSYYFWRIGSGKTLSPEENGLGLTTRDIPPLPEEMEQKFRRLEDLGILDMKAEARTEARLLVPSVEDPYLPALARLLISLEDYSTLVRLGLRHDYPSLNYPLAFWDIVLKYAEKEKLDPFLILAVMREESLFQQDVVSRAGALGVMQLMPATARGLGKINKIADLFNVERNIQLGTNYLSRLMAKFGFTQHALAAYNAGEANVGRWLAADYRDVDEFMEDIPFGETKGYVFRIMKTYSIMKALYGDEVKARQKATP